MTRARRKQTHKLSNEQRAQLIEWLRQGITSYRALKLLLIEHGFPVVNRQTIHYYRQKEGEKRDEQ